MGLQLRGSISSLEVVVEGNEAEVEMDPVVCCMATSLVMGTDDTEMEN